jgi:hypothetical protein
MRPGAYGEAVAKRVYGISGRCSDAEFELVDIKDFSLPVLDEAIPLRMDFIEVGECSRGIRPTQTKK